MHTDDPETLLKVKGCLWAVGNVGSMELGAPFLEETDVVEQIVKIAQAHPVMSLRGTAFFVLGLISRSIHGLEIISEYGWDSNTTVMGESLGLCIPTSLGKFFSYTPWRHQKASDIVLDENEKIIMAAAKQDNDAVNQRILELITDLGNYVLTKRALSELLHIKQKRPPGFREPQFFRKVMVILECHHYRLPIRRFVIDLFDRSVLRQVVLDEESSEEDQGSNDDSETGTERQRSISAPSAPSPL